MTRILVTRDIPDDGIKMLRKLSGVKIEIYKGVGAMPKKELLKKAKNADIIISLLTDKIDSDVMDAAGPSLKMIANYAVGFDNIDLAEAAKRKIAVTNTTGPEISESVAEHAVALIFALAHRIVECDSFTRTGKYKEWSPKLLLGTDVIGKTLGVVGVGGIGSALIRRMYDGFGIKIIYTDVKRNYELEEKYNAKYKDKMQLLKDADFVSLRVPLIPQTYHLIGKKELKAMKKTAFLINTSRGPIVDELALVKALEKNEIAGAGLDVYECEPLIDCNPRDTHALRKLPNIILTPHTASATIETRQSMSRHVAENIIAFLNGKTPPNLVKM